MLLYIFFGHNGTITPLKNLVLTKRNERRGEVQSSQRLESLGDSVEKLDTMVMESIFQWFLKQFTFVKSTFSCLSMSDQCKRNVKIMSPDKNINAKCVNRCAL